MKEPPRNGRAGLEARSSKPDAPHEPTTVATAEVRVRAVGLAVRGVGLLLSALGLFVLLPHGPGLGGGQLEPLTRAAAVALLGLVLLPWERYLSRPWGRGALVTWALAGIALVTAGVAQSGGAASELWVLYAVPLVACSFLAPGRLQWTLVATAGALYVMTVVAGGEPARAGTVGLTLSLLVVLSLLTGFMSNEIGRIVDERVRALSVAERRAELLSMVAGAAREVNRLEHDEVFEFVVGSALDLGLDACSIVSVDWGSATWSVTHGQGLPEALYSKSYGVEEGTIGLCLRRRGTVVVDGYQDLDIALPELREVGIASTIATPIWVDGELSGILAGGSYDDIDLARETVEAFELLAAHASRSIENANRYDQKRIAVERLRELDRIKSDFLSSVSHELRTPLTAIEGFAVTLAQHWEALGRRERDELLSRLNENARVLHEIVVKMLDFSNVDSGRFTPHPRAVRLAHSIESVLLRHSELRKSHPVAVDVAPDLVVRADPLLLDRVFDNLLANAGRYTPPGTPVSVAVEIDSDEAAISITDAGPGMPPDELSRLGDPFFRGGDLNERRVRGAGLGIALIMEILELHGSHLEVESRPGLGTRFWFRLPRLAAGHERVRA